LQQRIVSKHKRIQIKSSWFCTAQDFNCLGAQGTVELFTEVGVGEQPAAFPLQLKD
jgi:hypothetical protein